MALVSLVVKDPCTAAPVAPPTSVVDGRAVLSLVAVKEAGLRTAAVATALNVTARAVARVLPLGARLARERDIGLAQLQIDTGEIPSLRCAARLPRLSSA